ncbi:hypothetical protein [Exilibacterium tricleocarpae]|nr:hypothetical protein [Exilibacterium tricleocarpae]
MKEKKTESRSIGSMIGTAVIVVVLLFIIYGLATDLPNTAGIFVCCG